MKNPMQAFSRTKFDLEFAFDFKSKFYRRTLLIGQFHRDGYTSRKPNGTNRLYWHDSGEGRTHVRPRLNQPQVLTDYTPILVDGFVWQVRYIDWDYCDTHQSIVRDIGFKAILKEYKEVEWTLFMGVEKGSEYEEWARANDIPIYNKDMEVVA